MQLKYLLTGAVLAALAPAMPTTEPGVQNLDANIEARDTKIGQGKHDDKPVTDLVVSGDCKWIPAIGINRVNHRSGTRCRFYRRAGCQPKDHIGGPPGPGLAGNGNWQTIPQYAFSYTCWFA